MNFEKLKKDADALCEKTDGTVTAEKLLAFADLLIKEKQYEAQSLHNEGLRHRIYEEMGKASAKKAQTGGLIA